jgi:polysulfide reductase-like protein
MSAPETLAPPRDARDQPRSYYGRPVIKEPVWTWEIPVYFFTGGLGGASAGLAWLSELRGSDVLARRSWALALGGIAVSPALLISDLGRPARFLNMLRMFKVTSPMSVGSWLLAACGAATALAAVDALLPARQRRRLPAPVDKALSAGARPARPAAAALGLPVSTYTAALVANTSVPVWHEARLILPFLFGGGAAASAGAAAAVAVPARDAAPARRACVAGALMEVAASKAMEQRLGELGRPYHQGAAGRLNRLGDAMTSTGAMVVGAFGRRRAAAAAGGALVLAGALCKRWAVFRAGFQSAADPAQTVGPQRERIRSGATRGAEQPAAGG